jgi:hypothetical protein
MHTLLALMAVGNAIGSPIGNIPVRQDFYVSQTETCVRAVPKPIAKKQVFPNTKFSLSRERQSGYTIATGTETIELVNSDRLTITNTGCEYVTLVFEFDTNRIELAKINDRRYVYARSAWLMKQVRSGLNSPLDLQRGIAALEKYAATQTQPQLDKEIDYGGADMRSIVRLESVKHLRKNKVGAKIIFSFGPL